MRNKSAEEPYSDSLWEEFSQVDIADVVVDLEAPGLEPFYSYRVPETLQNRLQVGECVHISFSGVTLVGYVIARRGLPITDPLCGKLKPILGIVEDAVTINTEQLHIVKWMSERYLCDLLSALRCVAPATLGARIVTTVRLSDPNLRSTDLGGSLPQAHIVETLRTMGCEAELQDLRETANIPTFNGAYTAILRKGLIVETRTVARAGIAKKTLKAYTLGAAAEVLTSGGGSRRSPQQQRILNELIERARRGDGPMPVDELLQTAQANSASLRGLAARGLVQASEITVRRAPIRVSAKRTVAPTLTPGQQQATERLRACLDTGVTQTVLLFGVTASGKTEVYLNAIAHTLELGRSAIILVPEIALTAQVADVFVGRFGEQVAVLHSRLSEGERHDEWRRMQATTARIVVGARSAIFAPVSNVGLIVMDEEHEASYKQENTPRYSARDLAQERARLSGATLILGSATPSLESYFASEAGNGAANLPLSIHVDEPKESYSPTSPGRLSSARRSEPSVALSTSRPPAVPTALIRIEMPERIDNRPLPQVKVVDLREEFKQRRALFAQRLVDAMADRLRQKQQIILFLNRRGYAQFVLCRDCGWTAKCPNCAVSLAFHSYDRSLKCHHCDYTGRAPQLCPDCGGSKVKAFGIGTEKVEEEALNLFPTARVARMDRDTTARKGAHTRIVRGFRQGDADILIGTQMVAKGLDFPNVTLVGVISADTAINMPDFRASERTFQLLTQVAGRSGRGVQPGEVVIQTFSPDHYAVRAAVHHNYREFYEQEIVFRRELRYPPFSRFVNLICNDIQEAVAQERAGVLAAAMTRIMPSEIEVIGPSAAPISRLKNQYRFHVALRAPVDAPLSHLVRTALERLTPPERQGLNIDMDPLSMA